MVPQQFCAFSQWHHHLSIELIPKATEINSSYMSHLLMVKSMWYVFVSMFLQHWVVLPDWLCLDYNHQGDGHLIGSWPLSLCIGHSSTGQLDWPAGVRGRGGGSVMIFSVSFRYTSGQQHNSHACTANWNNPCTMSYYWEETLGCGYKWVFWTYNYT